MTETTEGPWKILMRVPITETKRKMMIDKKLPPLELQTKPLLTTAEAAYYLNRKAQSLRIWACYSNGPLVPVRMGGPLGWRTSDVRKLAGIAAALHEA